MEPERKKKLPEPPVSKAKDRAAASKPGTAGLPELGQAGGYDRQRDLLKPSKRAVDASGAAHAAGGVVGVAEEYADGANPSAAKFPRKARILSPEAAVMAKPQFLGVRVALLKRGEEVTLTGAEGAWYECITPDGAKGFIHKWRVDKMEVQLHSGDTDSETQQDDSSNDPARASPRA